jgi:hypothetical protein
VETPRKFVTAVTNLRGVSTNKTIIYLIAMQTYKELSPSIFLLTLDQLPNVSLAGLNPCCLKLVPSPCSKKTNTKYSNRDSDIT